jgi:ATP-dependent DNA helicase RecG
LRVRGELRGGFFGREMVHPEVRIVQEGAPAAAGSDAGLPHHGRPAAGLPAQGGGCGAGAGAAGRTAPAQVLPPACPRCASAAFPAPPRPARSLAALEDHSHPAWQRLKFEELLAQQVSQSRPVPRGRT